MKKVTAAFAFVSVLPFAAPASSDRVTNAAAERIASAAVAANERALEREAVRAEAVDDTSVLATLSEAVSSFVTALVGTSEAEPRETGTPVRARASARAGRSFAEEMASIPEVKKYLTYFTEGRGRGIAIRGYVRSRELEDRAREIFREEGVPVELVWLAQVESGWRSTALSPVGASGVWQFMPATAQRFGMDPSERGEFEKATRGAAKYLKWLNKRYDGSWPLAIGAYNCGEGNMDKAVRRNGGVKDFWQIARKGYLPTETINYVPSVLAASVFGMDPDRFELTGRAAVTNSISGRADS